MVAKTLSSEESDDTARAAVRKAKRFILLVATISALGGALFGYDTGVISGALLFMGPHFGLSPFVEGVVTSSLLLGAAAGAVLGGRIADRAGRRLMLIGSAIVFVVGTLGSALAPDVAVLVVSRAVLGPGGSATFWVFAALGVASVVFTARLVPETKGRSLEELESDMRERCSPAGSAA